MPEPQFVLVATVDGDTPALRPSYADVTERLLNEFGARHGLKVVSDLVLQCQTGPDGLRKLIAPELLEKTARVRLSELPVVALDTAL